MSGRVAALVAAALCTAFSPARGDQRQARAQSTRHPFMLFLTPLRPPQGDRLAAPFTKAVFDALERSFDTTTYQTILVGSIERAEAMSNHKKDLILYTDTTDWLSPGATHDTLVVWIKYRTGFLLGRTEIPCAMNGLKALPSMTAERVSAKVRGEFLGEVRLRGGPPNLTMTLVDRLHFSPPRQLYLPAGQHVLVSRHKGFATRVDTIDVLPGTINHKRVLLLPQK